jgi:hypothetical protein
MSPHTVGPGTNSSVHREGGSSTRNASQANHPPMAEENSSVSDVSEEDFAPRRWDKNGRPRRN